MQTIQKYFCIREYLLNREIYMANNSSNKSKGIWSRIINLWLFKILWLFMLVGCINLKVHHWREWDNSKNDDLPFKINILHENFISQWCLERKNVPRKNIISDGRKIHVVVVYISHRVTFYSGWYSESNKFLPLWKITKEYL